MQDYVLVSTAVDRLKNGMFGQLRRPLLLVETIAAFRNEQRRPPKDGQLPEKVRSNPKPKALSIGFGPWLTHAAVHIRAAALAGKLKIYLAPTEGKNYPLGAKDGGEPELLVPDLLRLIIPVRGGLPDHPVHVRRAPLGSTINRSVLWRVKTGRLLVKRAEFDGWYRREKLKRKWPSQKESELPRPGRPRTNELWAGRIEKFAYDNDWTARQPIVVLKSMLANHYDSEPPSDDTLARLVDRIFQETGDSRFRRKKRRSSRKTPLI